MKIQTAKVDLLKEFLNHDNDPLIHEDFRYISTQIYSLCNFLSKDTVLVKIKNDK